MSRNQRSLHRFCSLTLFSTPFIFGLNLLFQTQIWAATESPEAPKQKQTLLAASGSQKVQLLELFTSESCSSCPPADQWISKMKLDAGLWKKFVPVVFHVDYWNYLGWKDSLSTHAMTQRQRDIAATWESPSVYTPGVVLDGSEWKSWGKGNLPSAKEISNFEIKVYNSNTVENEIAVEIVGPKESKKKKALEKTSVSYRVYVARLGAGIQSKILGGENKGKLLQHNFVVLDWSSQTLSTQDLTSNAILKFPFQFALVESNQSPPNQSPRKQTPALKATELALAVWLERDKEYRPLQATGAFIHR